MTAGYPSHDARQTLSSVPPEGGVSRLGGRWCERNWTEDPRRAREETKIGSECLSRLLVSDLRFRLTL